MNKNYDISVSVVIPSYNGREFISEALESVFTQNSLPREVIVVDDASTDGTGDLVTAMARLAPIPVRLIRLPNNSGGPARPINIGIRSASGEFIAILDQDDLWMPSKLGEQLAVLRQNPGMAYVFSLTGYHDDPNREMQSPEVSQVLREASEITDGSYIIPGMKALRLLLDRGCFMLGYPGFLFRRKDWERKGGVNENLRIASDYDLVCWLSTQGSVGFLPKIHYLRRVHATNVCHNRAQMHLELIRVQSSYFAHRGSLGLERSLCEQFRNQAFSLAYFLREAGCYWKASRCHFCSLYALGVDRRTAVALAKLLPHWVYAKITLRAPSYNGFTVHLGMEPAEVVFSSGVNHCMPSSDKRVELSK